MLRDLAAENHGRLDGNENVGSSPCVAVPACADRSWQTDFAINYGDMHRPQASIIRVIGRAFGWLTNSLRTRSRPDLHCMKQCSLMGSVGASRRKPGRDDEFLSLGSQGTLSICHRRKKDCRRTETALQRIAIESLQLCNDNDCCCYRALARLEHSGRLRVGQSGGRVRFCNPPPWTSATSSGESI